MILLVRHTQVALAWKGRCYGRTDVPLSRAGATAARRLASDMADDPADDLADWRPDHIVHSGLTRTRILAQHIARATDAPLVEDSDWAERDFGCWEGRRWTQIYRDTGNAMDGMIDAPDHFRPGGGETTTELAVRAARALRALPPGRTIVVSHGGPIAALRGMAENLHPRDWLALVPALGQAVAFPVSTLCRRP